MTTNSNINNNIESNGCGVESKINASVFGGGGYLSPHTFYHRQSRALPSVYVYTRVNGKETGLGSVGS